MAKIIKHTFTIPNLTVKDGELVEGEPRKETYTFTLLYRGIGLFEEITNKSLFGILLTAATDGKTEADTFKNLMDKNLIQALASVSYVKIEGDRFHNNRVTVDEFKKSTVYPLLDQDIAFVSKLLQMAMECINDESQPSKGKGERGNRSPKK